MQLCYATRDGQSRRIAERISGRLAERGIPVSPQGLAAALPAPQKLAKARLVTVVAAVCYGRHLPEGERFLAIYRTLRAPPPVGLSFRQFDGKEARQGHGRGQRLSSQIDRPASTRSSPRGSHRRTPGLCALRLAGPAIDPLHHETDRRADRSQGLDRIYGVECGRRPRPADGRIPPPHPTASPPAKRGGGKFSVLRRSRHPIFRQPGKTVRLITLREKVATAIVG